MCTLNEVFIDACFHEVHQRQLKGDYKHLHYLMLNKGGKVVLLSDPDEFPSRVIDPAVSKKFEEIVTRDWIKEQIIDIMNISEYSKERMIDEEKTAVAQYKKNKTYVETPILGRELCCRIQKLFLDKLEPRLKTVIVTKRVD